ncbi:unnamed protein product [Phytophthora fragariaefolia]|uniref:Unnamed protein product n=1 Tax=Phytophthora fragariaefolia TaxID=1490495 RepID=A0A9W6YFX1_9STRA|nr:unnamed protein product [Phytophthora fragariaefolia]
MEGWTPSHTIAERIEFLVALERKKGSQEEASERFSIPRTTLLGYIAAKDDLFSTESDPWSRCVARPGLPPPTESSEALIVALVKQRDSAGIPLCRDENIDESASVIPGLKGKSTSAQNSWLTRRRAEFTPKKQEDGSEAFPVVIVDGGACVTKSSHQQADSPFVCETMAPCFRPDHEVYNLQVTERDLESFEPKEWLNDTVISYIVREFIDAHSSTYNFDGQLFGSIFMAYKILLVHMHDVVYGREVGDIGSVDDVAKSVQDSSMLVLLAKSGWMVMVWRRSWHSTERATWRCALEALGSLPSCGWLPPRGGYDSVGDKCRLKPCSQ